MPENKMSLFCCHYAMLELFHNKINQYCIVNVLLVIWAVFPQKQLLEKTFLSFCKILKKHFLVTVTVHDCIQYLMCAIFVVSL